MFLMKPNFLVVFSIHGLIFGEYSFSCNNGLHQIYSLFTYFMHYIVLIIVSVLLAFFVHWLAGLLVFVGGIYLFRWLQ